ncbi:hypothetical protein TNCV_2024571, partial [Trichonephila clavipes]
MEGGDTYCITDMLGNMKGLNCLLERLGNEVHVKRSVVVEISEGVR